MELVEFQASQLARAAADIADYLANLKVHLTRSEITIDPNTILADLTAVEATYTGYVLATVTWLDPSVADDGTVEVNSTPIEFRPTGTTVTNNIYAAYCVAAVGGDLLFAGPLDGAPLPMSSALSSIILVVRYRPAAKSLTVVIS